MATNKSSESISLREACIHESLKIIAQDGIRNLSIREVARRLGVSHGAPYRHFVNRDALVTEIAVQGMRVLQEYLMRGISFDKRDARENFMRFCHNYIDFAQEQHDYFQLILWTDLPDAQDYPVLKEEANRMYTLFSDLIRRVNANGVTGGKAHLKLTLQVFGTVHGLASLISSKKLAVLDYKKSQLDSHAAMIIENLYATLLA